MDLIFAHNVIYFLDPLELYLKEAHRILKPGGQVFWGVKDMAKQMDSSVYINTDWKKCLEGMKDVGFTNVEQQKQRLEGGQAYIPLFGFKK